MFRVLDAVARFLDGGLLVLSRPTDVFAALLLGTLFLPLLVLVHELGHAVVGLARTEGLVTVNVGRAPAVWRARVGRLALELSPFPARNGPAGFARIYARYGAGTCVALALAGPVAEACAATGILLAG